MTGNHTACVRLSKGQALIHTDGGRFRMARREDATSQAGCPMQMVVGALGACIVLTLDAVAKNKGIALTDFEARLGYHTDGDGHTEFRVLLQLDAALTKRERQILYRSAKLCEVGKILKSDVTIDYRVCESTSPL